MVLFCFQELPSGSRKVAIVGSAFEVTHENSLEQGQIQGNSGDISCPADKVPNWQPRILLGMVEARLVNNVSKYTHTHTRHVIRNADDSVVELIFAMQSLVSRQYTCWKCMCTSSEF